MTAKTDRSVQYFEKFSLNSKLSVWCFSPLQYGNLYWLWSRQIDKLALFMYGSTFISLRFSLQEGIQCYSQLFWQNNTSHTTLQNKKSKGKPSGQDTAPHMIRVSWA